MFNTDCNKKSFVCILKSMQYFIMHLLITMITTDSDKDNASNRVTKNENVSQVLDCAVKVN